MTWIRTDVLDALATDLGERAVVLDLIAAFLHDLPARTTAIVDALVAGEADVVSREVHTLHSGALLLGADELMAVVARVRGGYSEADDLVAAARGTAAELGRWTTG